MTRKKVTDYVDTSKIDTEKVKERAAEAAALLSDVSSKAATQAGVVAAQAKDRASNAKDWAQPRVNDFIAWLTPRAEKAWQDSLQAAAPQVEKAAGKAAPLIDSAHDKLVDDLLPKMVAAFNGAAANAATAQNKAALADSVAKAAEEANKKGSKKGWLVALAAGGAAVAGYVFWKRAQPQTDPWAEPWEQGTGADYSNGAARHSSGVGAAAGSAVAKGKEAGAKAAQTAKDLGARAYSAASPAFEAAKEKAAPVLEKAAPVLDAAKEKAAPVLDAAWATAQKASTAAQKRGGSDPAAPTSGETDLAPTESPLVDETVPADSAEDLPLVDEVPPVKPKHAGEGKQEG
jgi:colicin import membrane protein